MKSMLNPVRALLAVALVVGCFTAAGCSSTKAAYSAANTLDERAYVVTEHYAAVVKQAAELKKAGVLKGDELRQVRLAEKAARPAVLNLADLVRNYGAAKNAETEEALTRALDQAFVALANLVQLVKGIDGGAP